MTVWEHRAHLALRRIHILDSPTSVKCRVAVRFVVLKKRFNFFDLLRRKKSIHNAVSFFVKVPYLLFGDREGKCRHGTNLQQGSHKKEWKELPNQYNILL